MPVHIKCHGKKCSVSTPNGVHAYGTTRAKAKRQATLLRAIDHGWKPTGKKARESTEAAAIVSALLDGRDDIGTLDIPKSGKAYARLHGGIPALKKKEQLYINMGRDLANRGKPTRGFKDYDGSAYSARKAESVADPDEKEDEDVTRPLERGHVEPTHMKGRWPNGIAPSGKTSGKFKFPSNFKVGHAMK